MEKTIKKSKLTISVTKDYSIFKYINGNRAINKANLAKIINNYESGIDLFAYKPILVDGDFNIYDGQHRFEACKKLGLPVYCMTISAQTLSSLILINNAQKSWTQDDYLNSYIQLGNGHYIELKEFKERYQLNLSVAMELLVGGRTDMEPFKAGKFKVKSSAAAEIIAKLYVQIGEVSPKLKTRQTARCLMHMVKSEGFSGKTLIKKLKFQTQKVIGCENIADQMRMFEEVYNFKSRAEHVRLF